jgi:hypothetical protein
MAYDDVNQRLVRTTKDPNDIVSGSGSSGVDIDVVRAGSVAITNGATSVAITYSTAFVSTSYALGIQLVNVTDASNTLVIQPLTIISKTTGGCTVEWNTPVPTGNYIIDYLAVQPCSLFRANVEQIAGGLSTYVSSLLSASGKAVVECFEDTTSTIRTYQASMLTAKTGTDFTSTWSSPTPNSNTYVNWLAIDASCISLKSGVNAMTAVSGYTVTFPFPTMTSSSYAAITTMSNVTDSSPTIQPSIVTAKTISSFSVQWSVANPTNNYRLEWIARTY